MAKHSRFAIPKRFNGNKVEVDSYTNSYAVTEKDITYTLTITHLQLLRDYFSAVKSQATVAGWYADLPKEVREGVGRSGKVPVKSEEAFYPDIQTNE